MTNFNESKLHALIEPFNGNLRSFIEIAIKEARKIGTTYPYLATGKAQSIIINEKIREQVREKYKTIDPLSVVEKRGLFLLRLSPNVYTRFKKHRKSGKPSNVRTKQNHAILNQQFQIPGLLPEIIILSTGYQYLDKFGVGVRYCVSLIENNQLMFNIDIPETNVLSQTSKGLPVPKTSINVKSDKKGKSHGQESSKSE